MTDYDAFAHTFSESRKKMRWEEIAYILEYYREHIHKKSVLDVGCGNGRLLEHFREKSIAPKEYLWVDASQNLIEEAKKLHPKIWFECIDMQLLSDLIHTFDAIFFIASFHHLKTFEERVQVLKNAKNLLSQNGLIFLTNWNLLSPENTKKYASSKIPHSKNEFGSEDFQIKIGKFERFYHAFTLWEIDFLAGESGMNIVENRVFAGERNIVTILKK